MASAVSPSISGIRSHFRESGSKIGIRPRLPVSRPSARCGIVRRCRPRDSIRIPWRDRRVSGSSPPWSITHANPMPPIRALPPAEPCDSRQATPLSAASGTPSGPAITGWGRTAPVSPSRAPRTTYPGPSATRGEACSPRGNRGGRKRCSRFLTRGPSREPGSAIIPVGPQGSICQRKSRPTMQFMAWAGRGRWVSSYTSTLRRDSGRSSWPASLET